MINQNNSKTFISVNPSATNRKVSQFILGDSRIIKHKRRSLKQKFNELASAQYLTQSQQSSFDNEYDEDEDEKNANDIVEEVYELKKKEYDYNSSQDSSGILPQLYSFQKSQDTSYDIKEKKVKRKTSINRIHLTQNDDSIMSENNKNKHKLVYTQRNLEPVRYSNNTLKSFIKMPVPKIIRRNKQQEEQLKKLPQIWQQYYNILPSNQKSKATKYFEQLNEQYQQMDKERVLEPFLKDQKLKVNLMNPLIIRKDKPYYVAENKDNKNLIDNMKNENTNLNKDEYLVVGYQQILHYI